jgi:antitoxin (DNA-binding transcriptional repressor) of toxin-antitoxin stability system
MSPLTILFHSAFIWSNHLATTTYVSLVIVVATGLVGRFIYGLYRLDPDELTEMSALRVSVTETLQRVSAGLQFVAASCGAGLARVVALAQPQPAADGPGGLLLGRPGEALQVRRALAGTRPLFTDDRTYREFRAQVLRLRRLDVNLQFRSHFKRLMTGWRIFHVVLSILLLGLIVLHVWISILVGFKWIWSR